MDIGYARVSTDDQRLDLQRDALLKAGVAQERLYEEHASGARTDRPILAECLRSLRDGDTLVIWRLDRLGRSLSELLRLGDKLEAMHVHLRSLTEALDTSTATGRLLFQVLGALAEFERNLIRERTIAGLKAARARGHRGGRPAKMTDKQTVMAIKLLDDHTVTAADVATQMHVSKATLHRHIKGLRDRQANDHHPPARGAAA